MHKETKQMVQILEQAGWTIYKSRRKHYSLCHPLTNTILTIAGTTSDHRSNKNLLAIARRALVIDPRVPETSQQRAV